MPTIAFDFDDTYTEDPKLFREIICRFQRAGWTTIMVTARRGDGKAAKEVIDEMEGLLPIVFTSHTPKRTAALRAGYAVDVWVDDCPAMIEDDLPILGRTNKFSGSDFANNF